MGAWIGFIDYWLIALLLFFHMTTDFSPKILLTSDYYAVEFNDLSHKRHRKAENITNYWLKGL